MCVRWPAPWACAPPSSAGRTSSSTPTPCAASCAPRRRCRRRGARGRTRPRVAHPGAAGGGRTGWSPSRSTRCWPPRCRARCRRTPRTGPTGSRSWRPTRCAWTALPGPPPTALVANLPYNVAVPVLLHLLALLPSLRAGAGDGAGRGRRPARRPARLAHLRRAVGEGRVVRRGAPRRSGRAHRVLARAERRLRASWPGSDASRRRWRRPARRCSPSSTPPSPSAARRCAARSRRWPARRAAAEAALAHAGCRPAGARGVARHRGVRPHRGGACTLGTET